MTPTSPLRCDTTPSRRETAPLRYESVSIAYSLDGPPTIRDVDLTVEEGELLLVVGRTGSGKSTLLRAATGLVPHFSGGHVRGRILVGGRDTASNPPRELADVVGFVGQEPAAGFVCDTVEEELAYVMENLGIAPPVMRRRVEETLDLLGLDPLRHAPLGELSGGEQQRVAIASVLTASPRLLVLDEPTSALDPAAAEDVLAALTRLVHDVGLTVVLSEHRLERVVHLADRVAVIEDGRVRVDTPAVAMATSPVRPPVVEIGRVTGIDPLPTSIREARRCLTALRSTFEETQVPPALVPDASDLDRPLTAQTSALTGGYDEWAVLHHLDVEFSAGEVTAVMGRNGSGKTTLLRHLAGMCAPMSGDVVVAGRDPFHLDGADRIGTVGYVPQDAASLLYARSVAEELTTVDRECGLPPGTTADRLSGLGASLRPDAHPNDLSSGQRMQLAMSVVMAARPALLLLDEPTRGLDYPAKDELIATLRRFAEDGTGVVVASHDVEFVAAVADRVVVMAHGEVIVDEPARAAVCHSPVFAPQTAKVFHPTELLTVAEVVAFRSRIGTGR